eukprot:619978-Rhodomonas_salina.1
MRNRSVKKIKVWYPVYSESDSSHGVLGVLFKFKGAGPGRQCFLQGAVTNQLFLPHLKPPSQDKKLANSLRLSFTDGPAP